MLLWLVKIPSQYQLIMPVGHSKAMWQCKWHNLVANFGTRQCKWRHLMTKFGTNLEQIRMHVFKRNTNLISRNIANLYLRNVRASHSRFSSQAEQTLSTVSSFWFLPGEAGRVHAHPWLQVQVRDQHWSAKMIPFITRPRFRVGRLVFSPRRTCPQASPTSPSWLCT